MPLRKGSSPAIVSQNISEFHTGKTYAHTAAKFGKKRANAQAIAVALHTARQSKKRAEGGDVEPEDAPNTDIERLEGRGYLTGEPGDYSAFHPSWRPAAPSVYWKATHGIDTAPPPETPAPEPPKAAPQGPAQDDQPSALHQMFGLEGLKEGALNAAFPARMITNMGLGTLDTVGGIVSAIQKNPIDPATGEFTPEAVKASTDLSLLLGGGIRTAAAINPGIVPEGADGVFVGRIAPRRLESAEMMRDAGASPGEIWQRTGVAWDKFTGAPFREILDRGVRLNPNLLEPNPVHPDQVMIPEDKVLKLGDLYPHEELYKVYPWARDINVQGGNPLDQVDRHTGHIMQGGARIGDNTITLFPSKLSDMQNTIRHEVQHFAQFYDGLTPGGSWADFLRPQDKAAADRLIALNDQVSKDLRETGIPLDKAVQALRRFNVLYKQNKLDQMPRDEMHWLQSIRHGSDNMIDKLGELINSANKYESIKQVAFQNYQSIYGEALARASTERAERNALANKMQHPDRTISTMENLPVAQNRLIPSLRAPDAPWSFDPRAYEAFHGTPPPAEAVKPQASEIMPSVHDDGIDWDNFEKEMAGLIEGDFGLPKLPSGVPLSAGDIINHLGDIESKLGRDMTPEEIAGELLAAAKGGNPNAALLAKKNFPAALKTKVNKAIFALKKGADQETVEAINSLYWNKNLKKAAPTKTAQVAPVDNAGQHEKAMEEEEYYKAQEQQAAQAQAPAWMPEGAEAEGYSPFDDIYSQPERKYVPPGVFEKAKVLGLNQPGYHATSKQFDAFKLPEDLGSVPELGIHFGTIKAAHDRIGVSPQHASPKHLPKDEEWTPGIIPAIIKAEHPLELPDLFSWGAYNVSSRLRLIFPAEEVNKAMRVAGEKQKMENLRNLIEAHGYDSVAYRNNVEDPGSISYITWRPNHIRSFYAKFEPSAKHLANIASGIGGVAVYAMGQRKKEEDEPVTKRASGGTTPFHLRGYQESIGAPTAGSEPGVRHFTTPHIGMIHNSVPGRTDKLNMNVKGGSYILPASVVSGIGQGNSQAGSAILNSFFKMGPYGSAPAKDATPKVNYGKPLRPIQPVIRGPMMRMKMPQFAKGGAEETHSNVPIVAAGGEFVVPPHVVARLGGGDMKHGHRILDHFVMQMRKKTIEDMKKEKPPKA